MVISVRVMFVVTRTVLMLVVLISLASFFSLLEELEKFLHGFFDECLSDISIFDLSTGVSLNGLSDRFDTLHALNANIWEIFLIQLE